MTPRPSTLLVRPALGFADLEHLRAALRALAFGGRLAVLHRDGLGALHLPLRPALQAISFHVVSSFSLSKGEHRQKCEAA